MNRITSAVTLMELLIAIVLLTIIVLGISQLEFFGSFNLMSADRRAKIDNEISMALEHMSKEIVKAIGNEISNGANTVVDISNISSDAAIKVYVDYNQNGQRDAVPPDRWIAYRFTDARGNPAERYQLWYCPQCTNVPCTACDPAWGSASNIIARKISVFTPIKPINASSQLNNNFVTIELTTCWDPATADLATNPNGTRMNPCVDMNTRIKMPSVSTN